MSRKVLFSNIAVWSLGGLAFVALCAFCIYSHAPMLAELESTTAAPVTTTLASSGLEARLLNGKVTLTGTLPDQSAKDQMLRRAKESFGAGNFIDNLKVSKQSAFPSAGWFNSALALLPFANQLNNAGGFTLDSNTVTVRGLVESDEIRSKLISDAINAAGRGVRVDDKISVKGQITAAQAMDFQAKLSQMMVGKIVEFDTNSDVLTAQGKATLDAIMKVLTEVPGIPVEISGHTDARGDAVRNQNLSQRRARACLQYLAQKGVDAKRLSAKGYGASKPIAENNSTEGQQRNRRIEFTVLMEGK